MREPADPRPREPTGTEIDEAAQRLSAGEVIAVPTDTVYGLAVALGIEGASRALFELKGRPESVALPVIVATLEDAAELSHPDDRGRVCRLGAAFWPGDLTIVVRRAAMAAEFDLGADRETIGLRVPASTAVRELAHRVGPLGVSSANRHGTAPCEDPAAVRAAFGPKLYVLDGGRRSGAVSTVVDARASELAILRAGRLDLPSLSAAARATPSRKQSPN